jgi:thiol-disulfide isomerase/thioredoxin
MHGCYPAEPSGLESRHAAVTEPGDDIPMTPNRRLLITPALALLIAACSAAGAPTTGPASPVTPPDSSPDAMGPTDHPAMSDPAMASAVPTDEAPATSETVLGQAWATAKLTDVATGEVFRIADLAGQTVILETMAIWCPNCYGQQTRIDEALAQLGSDRVAYVVIDIDPSETAAALAQYRDKAGFSGRYAVADQVVARALAEEFGDQILNPPSTPVVFIGTDGTVTLTPFGPKSTDEIVALAQEHGA